MKIKKSFTLVEAVVATAITVVVLAGSGYGISMYMNLANNIHQQDVAIYAVQEKIEEIAGNVSNIAAYNDQYFNVTDSSGKNILISSTSNPPGHITVAQNSAVANLYGVNITISWKYSGRQESLTVKTALMRK
jgi:type II secretory pathway pseudopilin PulG